MWNSLPPTPPSFFLRIFFFLMWTILKVLILFLFYVLVFSVTRHVRSLFLDRGSNLGPPHWQANS